MSNSNSDDDMFHAVTMGEQSTWKKGYVEGAEEGRKKGFDEGFKLGALKGAELGKEVGFYAGYAAYVLKVNKSGPTKSRLDKLCQSIVAMANDFPDLNPRDDALTDVLSKLQSKFKQLTSLLNVRVEYKAASGSSTDLNARIEKEDEERGTASTFDRNTAF